MYMQSMIWFIGVVEDIADPDKVGRVRVRCLGYHTENKDTLKTKDLPWATLMQPITSAAMQGIGQSPTGMVQGTHVVGFFRDGTDAQDPIIMGTLGGGSGQEPKGRYGFEDPGGYVEDEDEDKKLKYPGITRASISGLETHESGDMNPLAKGTKHKTTVITREENRIVKMEGAQDDTDGLTVANSNIGNKLDDDTTNWKEPASPYKAVYPHNHVMETKSGHVREYDDTSGEERIHESHKTGTFYEIDKDGNKVTKVIGDNYSILAGKDYAYVKGEVTLTIDDNCNTYVKGNWIIQVDGNKVETIVGTSTTTVTGAGTMTFNGTGSQVTAKNSEGGLIGLTTHTHVTDVGLPRVAS